MVGDRPIAIDVLMDDLYCIAVGRPACRPIADVCRDACLFLAKSVIRADTEEPLFAFYADALTRDIPKDGGW